MYPFCEQPRHNVYNETVARDGALVAKLQGLLMQYNVCAGRDCP